MMIVGKYGGKIERYGLITGGGGGGGKSFCCISHVNGT